MEQEQGSKNSSFKVAAGAAKWLVRGARAAAFGGPMGWVFGGGFLIFLVLIVLPIFAVIVIALGLSGGKIESPLQAQPVEAAPTNGDPLGLADDFCEPFSSGVCNVDRVKLKNLLEDAASWAKIPAAVLAGVLSIEGRHVFWYTNEQIVYFSADLAFPAFIAGIGGQGIDPMNSTQNSCGAIGPMQMLVDSSVGYPPLPPNNPPCDAGRVLDVWVNYKSAVNIAGVASLSNPDARNIRNALYGAAWKLKCHSGTATIAECSSGSFGSYDNDTTDSWEKEDTDKAAKGYYGSCDVDFNGNGIIDPDTIEVDYYCKIVWEYYLDYSGGGTSGEPLGWPTSGVIKQGPWTALGESHYQRSAIDISKVGGGEPIYATHDGNVFKFDERNTAPDGGCGIYVVVFGADGFQSQYCHMKNYSPCLSALPNNSFIKAGTYLGDTGSTGFSTGDHLHYAIKEKSSFISASKFNSQYLPPYNLNDSVQASYSGGDCKT